MGNYEIIRGRDNQRLKWVRSVRDGKENSLIFIEGFRLAKDALNSPVDITEAYFSQGIEGEAVSQALLKDLEDKGIRPIGVKPSLFNSLADTENTQGIVLLAKRPWLPTPNDSSLAVYLHEINNPANLGAVVRTAEAAGASALLASPRSADAFSPRSIRASMGSCFRLPIVEKLRFEDAASWAGSKDMKMIAAATDAETSYTEIDWSSPKMLVLGSEAHGLQREILDRMDETVRIPMSGSVESLNLAVSAGIILFEARRQRTSGRLGFTE